MSNENTQIFVQAQKKTYGKCLYKDLKCDGKPIDAHSIQNANVLELIQTDGHVLMPDFRLVHGAPKLEFIKIGRNDASTFTGLCSKHDAELFKSIDTEPLDVDNCEHLRQLAYRAAMREFHTHLLNSEKAWALHDQLCKAEGHNPAEVATAASILAVGHAKKGQEVLRYRNKHFDTPLSEGKTPDIRHLIITMDGQAPVLAASALFSSGFTADGDIIGPTLNVVPLNESKSVAVISYPAEQAGDVTTSLANIFDANEKTLKYELAKLIIQRVENFTLCPAHYEKWSDDKKARVLRELKAAMDPTKESPDHEDLNIFL
jgi:hypothetical protein